MPQDDEQLGSEVNINDSDAIEALDAAAARDAAESTTAAISGEAASLFDESGKLNEGTRGLLKSFLGAFAAWIEKNR